MRKIIITIHFIFLLAYTAASQSYEGTVGYQKKDEKAIVIEFPYPASVVEDAIVDKMEKLGFKKKESKGFLVYKNAVLPDISSEPADYMIRVERKSRKDKDESIVYLLVSRNDENIIARSDALINSNAKTFLNRLSPDVDAFNLEVEIKDQESAVSKAERKLKDLRDDQESMEKKIKKLQDDLKDNAKDQQDQQKEIEKQKQVLESMKAKRKIS
jgi:hypothetical protein